MKLVVVTVGALGAALALAACSADPGPAATTTTGEDDLSIMDMACRSETPFDIASFDLTPVQEGDHTVLQGTLIDADGASILYTCSSAFQAASSGGGGGDIVITCDEQNAPIRLQHWNVAVVRIDEGRQLRAKIERVTVITEEKKNDDIFLACTSLRAGFVAPPYATIAPFVHRACAGCHVDQFDSLAKIKDQQSVMLALISSGAMPRRDHEWKDTFEGRQVLAFLAKSPDLR